MSAKHHRHIALPGPLAKFIGRQVAGSRYTFEPVRAGLHLPTEHAEAGAHRAREDHQAHG